MSVKLWKASTSNAFSTTLNGTIAAGDNTITLTSVAGLQAPGVLVIDRVNSVGTATPALREYISFTGISTNTLTGVTRALGGSSAQSHSSGSVIEETMSVSHWGDLVDFLNVSHDSGGNIVISSLATIATARIHTHLNASGASISGVFPIYPTWAFTAFPSSVSAYASPVLSMPVGSMLNWISVTLNRSGSGASYIFDVNKNGSSIFAAGLQPTLPGGATFLSTASISTRSFNSGDKFWVDIDAMGGPEVKVTVQGGT